MNKLMVLPFSLLLAACAGYGGRGLVVGQSDVSEVVRRMGQPAMQWAETDGSRRLVYPRGPMGVQTYMVWIDRDGRFLSMENALTEQTFGRVEAGMSQDDILHLLGPPEPSWTIYFKARDELVWEWRYCDVWGYLARFDVMFDATQGIVRSTFSQREYCGPNSHCWCQR